MIQTLQLPILLSLLSLSPSTASIHLAGSGTTNPSKCYWKIFSKMQDQSKLPLRLSYRAVGSSTGQFEFLGVNNTKDFSYDSFNDFGSGDIPIKTGDYEAFTAAGKEMIHVPFLLGAISLFHSIPGVPSGEAGLNLTSCQIAKIFKRQIKYWDDPEILEENEELRGNLPYEDYPIKVARRVQGSSSTASVTEFLHLSCPTEWPASMVGSKITWDEDTMKCEGSGGMTKCIRDNAGTLGYIDSGHGHEENLVEIELKNKYGTYLSSKKAAEMDGIAAAASVIPATADLNFGDVKLLNMNGQWTWPIVAMTYVYIRKDLTHMPMPENQALLKYFAQSLFDKDIISECLEFGFTLVPESVKRVALKGIDSLILSPGAPTWTREVDTSKGGGQGDYVFSVKRRSYAEYDRGTTQGDVEDLKARIVLLEEMLSGTSSDQGYGTATIFGNTAFDNQSGMATAAVVLGSISLVLWAATVFFLVVKRKY